MDDFQRGDENGESKFPLNVGECVGGGLSLCDPATAVPGPGWTLPLIQCQLGQARAPCDPERDTWYG